MKRFLGLLSIALSIFLLDFATKALVDFFIQPIEASPLVYPFGGVAVFKNFMGIDFCLNNVSNRGAAWGLFASFQDGLLLLRCVVILLVVAYMVFSKKAEPYDGPLTLIIAGALGNVLDYFVYGHVVDMFHFVFWGYSYPVFNVADISIFCGVAWMLLLPFFTKKEDVKIV